MSDYYRRKITEQINRLNEIASSRTINGQVIPLTTERVHTAIGNAQQWLDNGGQCRYENEDCDILQGLYSDEFDLRQYHHRRELLSLVGR